MCSLHIEMHIQCSLSAEHHRSVSAVGRRSANKQCTWDHFSIRCLFSQKCNTDTVDAVDILLLLCCFVFPVSLVRRCCFLFVVVFVFNPASPDNNDIQVSLLESCEYLLQCTAADLLSVSVPLAGFTALTSFSMISCSYCLNNYGTQKVGF